MLLSSLLPLTISLSNQGFAKVGDETEAPYKGAFSPPTSGRRLCVTLTEYIFEGMYNSYVESDDRFALAPLKDDEKNRREKIFFKGVCSLVAFAKS
jgi:hypothetical protein